MFIIKHALANLKRNIGRNLLLSIVLFVIIFITAVSIVIHATSTIIIDDYKQRFGSEVTIQNRELEQNDKLSVSALLSFGASEYLQNKRYLAKVGYVPKNLQALDDDGDPTSLKGYLYGSSREEINDDFQKGTRKLIEGTHYTKENECIISKKFAELNQLKVGDTIILQGNDATQPMDSALIISGIYDDLSLQADTNAYDIALTNQNNEIYASLETVMDTAIFQNYGALDMKLYLKNPSMLSALQEELKDKGLPDSYEVTTDEEGYQKIIAPVEHLATISESMMTGVFLIGSIVLILISIMVMKERTYEIGVLRAIGMNKKQVVSGLLSEILIVTAICLSVGLACAQFSAKPIANGLLASQVPYDTAENHNPKETTSLATADISLSFDMIIEICLISLGLASIASAGGILFTIRYEPMKILSQRN